MGRVNQVWSADITYIRMAQGFVYLVAVIDWFSRFVLSWSLSFRRREPGGSRLPTLRLSQLA